MIGTTNLGTYPAFHIWNREVFSYVPNYICPEEVELLLCKNIDDHNKF